MSKKNVFSLERSAGILLPISSLPSPYGIGTFGQAAYDFVDFLVEAKQRWWQVLPLSPTSYGDSPYQSFSAYAGNPYFIDLDLLAEEGLLQKEDYAGMDWGTQAEIVDYGKIYRQRFAVLALAKKCGWTKYAEEIDSFRQENAAWLEDYALFMALKREHGMRCWLEWEELDLRLRHPDALAKARQRCMDEIEEQIFIQFMFARQWKALRAYAHEHGIGIIGDIPLYVALDSADVWAEPENFQLDEQNQPIEVAGVPPDYFTADGQLWGNPLYDWDKMQKDGYSWWQRRISAAADSYDILRIDHFRGLESYWAVPFGEKTAKIGRWVKGPAMDLMRVLLARFPQLQFIAEDLGYLTPEVKQFLHDSGLPGMKILEFAFDSREPSDYLPHTYTPHCVCYAGTHDNPTVMGWREEANQDDLALAKVYLGLNEEEGFNWGILRGGASSVAVLFLAQLQDFLGLGKAARMNTPGIADGNWKWRVKAGVCDSELAEKIALFTMRYGRVVSVEEEAES